MNHFFKKFLFCFCLLSVFSTAGWSQVTVEVTGRSYTAQAVTVGDAERDAVFSQIKAKHPRFAGYEAKAGGRKIPIVRLDG